VKRLAFAVPGDLATPTGGYAYDRHIVAELGRLGWHVDVLDLGDTFPRPSAAELAGARAQLLAVADDVPIVIDGLAYGVMPEIARAVASRHPLIALVHHPLAFETGLSPSDAARFHASERAALACASAVIASSPSTARLLASEFDVAPDKISVVVPGTEPRPPARGSGGRTVALLAVGSLVPRKGYDILIDALAEIAGLDWRLAIAGDRTRDPATAAAIDGEIERRGLAERIAILGAVDAERLAVLYDEADLFVLASRFEGYGMAFAEALAHGLPLVGTTAGAIPDTVPEGAGMLVPPDDARALAQALRELIENDDARRTLAAGARRAALQLPTWPRSAELFARAVEAIR
jgi:glycosyltransferase involved in cell wall biosynthesis